MNKWLAVFLFFPFGLWAQQSKDMQEATQLVHEFFTAFHAADTAALREMFLPNAQLQSWNPASEQLSQEAVGGFLEAVGMIQTLQAEEKWEITQAWSTPNWLEAAGPYTFLVNGELHHQGWNQFTFIQVNGRWKIARILDSRIRP